MGQAGMARGARLVRSTLHARRRYAYLRDLRPVGGYMNTDGFRNRLSRLIAPVMPRLRYSAVVLLCACASPPPPPPPAPPPEPLPSFAYSTVWTAQPGVPLIAEASTHILPHPAMRLEVVGFDSLGLHVRCDLCPTTPAGRVSETDVVGSAMTPAAAAEHGTIADFALAVRQAALERDVAALRQVMDPDFVFSLRMGGGPIEAVAAWEREAYASLDALVALIDRGLGSRWHGTGVAVRDELWVAPAEFASDRTYPGLRAGFRRVDGRWVWTSLVRGQ
jgi:hypothetical protein